MDKKREPLLVDKFLAEPYGKKAIPGIIPRDYWESTRSNLMLAKRFVLDTEAARYCAEMLRQAPRIIADAQDFAIPPFDRTYIEIPFRVWYQTLSEDLATVSTADTRVGYLIVKSQVRVIVESADDVALSPISYHLNQPLSLKQEVEFASKLMTSRISFDLFYWGGSAIQFGVSKAGKVLPYIDEWQKEGLRSLRANHSFSFNLRDDSIIGEMWDSFYYASAGDLRNIIGLLLFLNRTSKIRYEREEGMQPSRFIKHRNVTLLKHRVITIHVNPIPMLMRLTAGDGIRRRLHDVRGHFCHNEVARSNGHDHEWEEDAERDLHWVCTCGGLRWWRKEHKRGNESKGIVTSDYEVKE